MATASYSEFLQSKVIKAESVGFVIESSDIHPLLFDWQRDIVLWALERGRAAIFADCGLGKTLMQLEWLRHVGGTGLIVCPLSIAEQTIREGKKIGLAVRLVRRSEELADGINITNYEMIRHFVGAKLQGIVLDESSILKSIDGKTRKLLLNHFTHVPMRLCCTATPCPNDIAEIANHSQFLGIMQRIEMLASFFVHDEDGWRLRGHAAKPFYRWLSSWAMAFKSPADIGYDGSKFVLPKLTIRDVIVPTEWRRPGHLFAGDLRGITDRYSVRRQSVTDRVGAVIDLINKDAKKGCDIGHEYIREKTEIQSDVARISSGASKRIQREDKGQEECSPPGIICTGRVAQDRSGDSSEAVAATQSGCEKTTTPEYPRDIPGNVSGYARDAERAMCNLRILRYEKPEDIPHGRSLSSYRKDQGTALPELQSCNRETDGRSNIAEEGSVVFGDKWLIWCGLNSEQLSIEKALTAIGVSFSSIHGNTKSSDRLRLHEEWCYGNTQVMLTKPKVFGYGMNWQHCSNMVFMGLGDSYESYYQCIRRCWRYGQARPVDAYVVVTDHEEEIVENVRRKEREAEALSAEIITAAKEYEMEELKHIQKTETFENKDYEGDNWKILQGDCVERLKEIDADSIDLSVFSPPFLALYTYSATERDLGNCKNDGQLFEHFRFVIDEILRVTKPGRLCCVHAAQVATTLNTHGVIGLKDFRGGLVEQFISRGWIYHGEVCIDKDPQAQAIRTHSKGLLFVQLKKDSSWLRPAMADYILVFRKPGENAVPIHPDINNDEWIEWARPIWYGIRESDTLNAAEARSDEDDRHVCPLQLGTIERVVRLWSNRGETVLSPFAGIGSEGYVAVKEGRQFIGIELKPLYARTAVRNLERAEKEAHVQRRLF